MPRSLRRWIAVPVALVRDCVERFVEIEAVDRAVALAALAFTALIPLGVVVGSFSPAAEGNGLVSSLVRRFELNGQTRELLESVFSPPEDVRSTVSVLGLLLVAVSALSFTRGLQRVYERSWRLKPRGVRGTPAGLMWLGGLVVFVALFSGLRYAVIDWLPDVLGVVFGFAISFGIWLFTPYTLLGRRLDWRPLVPTALLTAAATTVVGVFSTVYMPHAIGSSAERYGPIGVTIALVSWLVVVGFALVGCAATGAVLAEWFGLTPVSDEEPGPDADPARRIT